MTEHRIVARETITEDSVEHRETLRKDYAPGAPHGDEEAGGAIGAASGATAGAIDQKDKDDTVVVTREERRA
jgi:hypothetical protein